MKEGEARGPALYTPKSVVWRSGLSLHLGHVVYTALQQDLDPVQTRRTAVAVLVTVGLSFAEHGVLTLAADMALQAAVSNRRLG